MARRAGPGPGLLLGRLLRRRGGRRGERRASGRRGAERGGSRLAGAGLPGRDLPGGTMRVAKWLTGLLYQLSLFIARSWEVHFHPRQGKVTARRHQQRGGGSGLSGTPGRSWGGGGSVSGGARWGALALQGLQSLPGQPASQASREVVAGSGFEESCAGHRTPSGDHAVGARGAGGACAPEARAGGGGEGSGEAGEGGGLLRAWRVRVFARGG